MALDLKNCTGEMSCDDAQAFAWEQIFKMIVTDDGNGCPALKVKVIGGSSSAPAVESEENTISTLTYTIGTAGKTTSDISQIFINGVLMYFGVDYTLTAPDTVNFGVSIAGKNIQIYFN